MMKKLMVMLCSVGMLLGTQSAWAVRGYVSLVPNGSVFSCATCHTSAPDLNPFGRAFASQDWGPNLARLDSDGDGFSNGTELGDPDGTGTPTPGATVTNPGDASSKPAVVAPTITTHPQSQTVTAGANVTFTVAASGTGPFTYQWKKDNQNIAGANAATLTLNAVTAANAGSYTVQVSNSAGSPTSNPAILTVNPVVVALSVTLTSPTNEANYVAPADVLLEAEVTSSEAVASVELYVGTNLLDTLTTAPYSALLTNVPKGEYIFTAVVTDASGSTAISEPVTVTVSDPQPPPTNLAPVVEILTPEDGSVFYRAKRIVFTARASDPDGRVQNVQLFSGTTLLGTATPVVISDDDDDEHDGDDDDSDRDDDDGDDDDGDDDDGDDDDGDDDDRDGMGEQPTTVYVLPLRGLRPGSYTVTAKATDNAGAVTTSAPVHFTIKSRDDRTESRRD